MLLLIPFWYYNNPNFVLFNKVIPSASNTAYYINNNLDSDGVIMAFPGYILKLIYQTNNKVVGSYPDPDDLPHLLDYYNVSYYIFGEYYTYGQKDRFNLDTIEYVKNNPDKFELIATIQEDYSDFYDELDSKRADEIYIYKVKT